MARLAERKAAAETEYATRPWQSWDEYQLGQSGGAAVCEFDSLTALRAQVGRPARQDPRPWQRERERYRGAQGGQSPLR